jgi:hypothetical protein
MNNSFEGVRHAQKATSREEYLRYPVQPVLTLRTKLANTPTQKDIDILEILRSKILAQSLHIFWVRHNGFASVIDPRTIVF